MKRWWTVIILLLAAGLAVTLVWQWRERFFAPPGGSASPGAGPARYPWLNATAWIGSPGPLSQGHAALSTECQACHVPFRRVPDARCLGCHAEDRDLLSRRDTAFHADGRGCVTCHTEHQGRRARISRMEHAVVNSAVACTACHVDRHQQAFGQECATCHGTESWKLAEFQHPSPRSRVCAECHVEPPSHRMMHFEMVDRAVTGQRDATVVQCWRCHTTDHWNNIRGVGMYVHR